MSSVTYRNATPDDAAAIRSLWRQLWSEQSYEVNLPSKIAADPDLVIVAEADGMIVGTVMGGWDGWWAWIYRLAVARPHRRRGIATQLLRLIHSRLRERGADAACAIVNPGNTAMYALLTQLGYSEKKHRLLACPMTRESERAQRGDAGNGGSGSRCP